MVKKYLDKKTASREQEALENSTGSLDENGSSSGLPVEKKKHSNRFGKGRDSSFDESNSSRADNRRGFFGKRRHANRNGRRETDVSPADEECREKERPAFHSDLHGQSSTNKKVQPRAVAIPYSCLKKDRFYDWPPDPTVSRATPVNLYNHDDLDDSLTLSVQEATTFAHEYSSTLRRRRNSANGTRNDDIPQNISF